MLLKLSLNKKGVYLVWKEDVINFKARTKANKSKRQQIEESRILRVLEEWASV